MSIRLGAEKRAEELGYNILKVSQLEQHNLQGIDGILAIGKFTQKTLQELQRTASKPCVIGSNFPLEEFDSVNTDFYQATEIALTHLLNWATKKLPLLVPKKAKICMVSVAIKHRQPTLILTLCSIITCLTKIILS